MQFAISKSQMMLYFVTSVNYEFIPNVIVYLKLTLKNSLKLTSLRSGPVISATTLFPLNTETDDHLPSFKPENYSPLLNYRESLDTIDWTYYDSSSFNQKLTIFSKCTTSFFHLNINSLNLHLFEFS